MTLILTVNGHESIWLLADRRLSARGRPPKDDAHKVMFLDTTDGIAILGYAGLGATALGTEPADWMSSVLRGRSLPLEQSLSVLAGAMERQFPQHLKTIPVNSLAHNVIVTAFLGNEVRLYTIDLVLAPDQKRHQFRCTRWQTKIPNSTLTGTPRVVMGGTGGLFLYNNQKWIRGLLDLIKANDHRQVSAYTVADHLANLNYQVHLGIGDKSVGPSCIVAWRHRKEGVYKGGGGHLFYTGVARDSNSPSLPTISNGMDIQALTAVLMPHMTKAFQAMLAGEPPGDLDKNETSDKLACLPDKPDENLR